jgi:thiol-disulfide isomerase/thioredoxin
MNAAPRRRWLLAAAGVLAAAGGAGWSWWRSESANAAGSADDAGFWTLRFPRPEGGELVLAELRGRPLVLNFWATWCAPCVREMPELDRFHRAHGTRVHVVGLAVDTLVPVQAFLAKLPMGFHIGLSGMDGIDLARRLGNGAGVLPFTVVFDADGRIVQRKVGETNQSELEAWTKRL